MAGGKAEFLECTCVDVFLRNIIQPIWFVIPNKRKRDSAVPGFGMASVFKIAKPGQITKSIALIFGKILGCSLLAPTLCGRSARCAQNESMSLYVEAGIHHSTRSVAFSLDGDLIAASSLDRTIKIWDVHSSRELMTLKVLASCNEDGTVTIWNIQTETIITTLTCSHNSSSPIALPEALRREIVSASIIPV